jgi:hypothetical protein
VVRQSHLTNTIEAASSNRSCSSLEPHPSLIVIWKLAKQDSYHRLSYLFVSFIRCRRTGLIINFGSSLTLPPTALLTMKVSSSSSCFLKADADKQQQQHKESKSLSFCSWDQQSTTTANSTEEFDLPAKKTSSTCCSGVPRSLWLNQTLRDHAKKLGKIPLVPLNCTFGVVNPKPAVTLAAALKQERKSIAKSSRSSNISIVFAVRHPGCVQCREHGQQLSELLKEDGMMHGIPVWGIVKDTKDQSLLNFYEDYFHFPLYMDSQGQSVECLQGHGRSPSFLGERHEAIFSGAPSLGAQGALQSSF